MAKAELHLSEDPTTGKIVVPAGVTFAHLFYAWREQYALVDRMGEELDKPGLAPSDDHTFCHERDYCLLIEQALWERQATCLDDLRMLAQLALTYEGSDSDDCVVQFALAVHAVIGPLEASTLPAALFAPPSTKRVGLSI